MVYVVFYLRYVQCEPEDAESRKKASQMKLFEDTTMENMSQDEIDARGRRRTMILNSLSSTSAQKNYKKKKKCVAFVKPLPNEKERPPIIEFEEQKAQNFKISCSPITFRTTSLPRILRNKLMSVG